MPLYLTVKVPLFTCPPVDGRKEGRNKHIPCLRLAILGDIRKINVCFTLFTHLSHLSHLWRGLPSLTYKRTWHPDSTKMVV